MKLTDKEIEYGLIQLIKEGKLAAIINKDEISYINASQVKVKCPHCGKIVNEGKYNPHQKNQ
jgi:transposase-like protein